MVILYFILFALFGLLTFIGRGYSYLSYVIAVAFFTLVAAPYGQDYRYRPSPKVEAHPVVEDLKASVTNKPLPAFRPMYRNPVFWVVFVLGQTPFVAFLVWFLMHTYGR